MIRIDFNSTRPVLINVALIDVFSLQRTINELELKCEDLQNQVDSRKEGEKHRSNEQLQDRRRSCSVPSLPDVHEIARKMGYEYLGYGIDLPVKGKKGKTVGYFLAEV